MRYAADTSTLYKSVQNKHANMKQRTQSDTKAKLVLSSAQQPEPDYNRQQNQ